MTKLIEVKKECNKILKNGGVKDYVNNTLLLCSHVLKIKKSNLILIDEVTNANAKKIFKLAYLRCNGKPLQYIIGNCEFYNNIIYVNKNVLIPRNETEQLCDLISNQLTADKKLLDLCTGSGCIGLGIKKAVGCEVTLSDVSRKAIRVAKKNATKNSLNVKIIKSDLFEKIKDKFDVIVSNPPYIKTKDLENLAKEVGHEPSLALDGKTDGLYFYKKIINSAPEFLNKFGEIYFECGVGQASFIAKYLEKNFEYIKIVKDYYGKNRFVYARIKG